MFSGLRIYVFLNSSQTLDSAPSEVNPTVVLFELIFAFFSSPASFVLPSAGRFVSVLIFSWENFISHHRVNIEKSVYTD